MVDWIPYSSTENWVAALDESFQFQPNKNSESLQSNHFRVLHLANIELSQSIYCCILCKSTSRSRAMSSSSSSSPSTSDAETLRRSRILKSKLYLDVLLPKVKLYIYVRLYGMFLCVLEFCYWTKSFDQSGSNCLLGVVRYSVSWHREAVRILNFIFLLLFAVFWDL